MESSSQAPTHNLPKELSEVAVVHISDPTAAGDSVEVLDQDIISLGKGSFSAKRVTVPLEDCCLLYQWTDAQLRSRTRVHKDFDACTILGPNAHGSLDGADLQPYTFLAAGPSTEIELIVDGGYESVALLVPPRILHEHLALRRIKVDFDVPEQFEIWHPATEVAQHLFELGVRIADVAENSPSTFNDNHWARHGAQVEYMDALAATIESCDPKAVADDGGKGKSYSQIVKACEDYTLKLDGRRPYLSELCAEANVSQRTLQYAFHDIMGMSPLTYLIRLRLHRAREELRKAEAGSITVTDVAMNWGFWHFGEFSRAYKNCFGEKPSNTLRQTDSGT